jgi:hypothetical protein
MGSPSYGLDVVADSLDEAKRQFQVAWEMWLEWADLAERQRDG